MRIKMLTSYIIKTAGTICGTLFVYRYGLRLVATMVGTTLPMYKSYKALEPVKETETTTKETDGWFFSGSTKVIKKKPTKEELRIKDNERQTWLVYWTIYGLFSTTELYTDIILSWIPFYYIGKIGLLFWLQYPIFRSEPGALFIYNKYVKDIFANSESNLDEGIYEMSEFAREKINELSMFAISSASSIGEKLIKDKPENSKEKDKSE